MNRSWVRVPVSAHFRGSSSVGRALASQAEGRGFEPRLPLYPLSNHMLSRPLRDFSFILRQVFVLLSICIIFATETTKHIIYYYGKDISSLKTRLRTA